MNYFNVKCETEEEFVACQIIAFEMGYKWQGGRRRIWTTPKYTYIGIKRDVLEICFSVNTIAKPHLAMSTYKDTIPAILNYGREKYA